MEGRLKDIKTKLANLMEHLREDKDGYCPGLNNSPRILCAYCIPESSPLIQQLQSRDATHGTNLAKLEAHLTQTHLHLHEAIIMASASESQGVPATIGLII